MDEQTVANRIKSYIPPELRGIPQALYEQALRENEMLRKTVTPYIPPELRPLGLAAKQAGDMVVAMNPITMILREAGGKSRQFFDSGGKDYQAGLGALLDTALLSAGPIAGRIAYGAKEPMKAGLRYMQDLFYPLGAPDEVAEQAVKIADPSKRDFMKKAGTAGILSVVPAVRGIEEIMPTAKTIEGATVAKASPKIVGGIKEVLSGMKKYDSILKEESELDSKFGGGINPSAAEESTRLYDDGIETLFDYQGQAALIFQKSKKTPPDVSWPDRDFIRDKQGNKLNKVLNASEKQAVKEMFENMSDTELGRVADELVDEETFIHPDALDNFLKQVEIRKLGDPETFLDSERVSSWMISKPDTILQQIKENPTVLADTPMGRDAREFLKNY